VWRLQVESSWDFAVQLIPEHGEANAAALQDNIEQTCEGPSKTSERPCEDRKTEEKRAMGKYRASRCDDEAGDGPARDIGTTVSAHRAIVKEVK
jgi:hypothetical protein